jgi:hypothetical protein
MHQVLLLFVSIIIITCLVAVGTALHSYLGIPFICNDNEDEAMCIASQATIIKIQEEAMDGPYTYPLDQPPRKEGESWWHHWRRTMCLGNVEKEYAGDLEQQRVRLAFCNEADFYKCLYDWCLRGGR